MNFLPKDLENIIIDYKEQLEKKYVYYYKDYYRISPPKELSDFNLEYYKNKTIKIIKEKEDPNNIFYYTNEYKKINKKRLEKNKFLTELIKRKIISKNDIYYDNYSIVIITDIISQEKINVLEDYRYEEQEKRKKNILENKLCKCSHCKKKIKVKDFYIYDKYKLCMKCWDYLTFQN